MNSPTVPITADWRSALARAMELHRSGFLDEAIARYRQVLEVKGDCFDALRLLGAALQAQSQYEAACAILRRAVSLRPDFDEVWGHLAGTLESLARPSEAASTWNDWGLRLLARGKLDAAANAFDRAIALAPDHAAPWNNRGLAFDAGGQSEKALVHFDAALQRDPGDSSFWCNRGKALCDLRRAEAALESYEKAIALSPNRAEGWIGRASAHRLCGQIVESLCASDVATRLAPQSTDAWTSMGASLNENGDFEQAMACLGRALEISPGNLLTRLNLSLVQLTIGDFASGWTNYEARAAVQGKSEFDNIPVWRGTQPLSGKSIVLLAEQGFADTLQFCRYAGLLASRGAAVSLMVQPTLRELLAAALPNCSVLGAVRDSEHFDFRCWMLSLPCCLGATAQSIPTRVPYLVVDQTRRAHWQRILDVRRAAGASGRPLRIGLVCSGNPLHMNDRSRSVPLFRFRPLIEGIFEVPREWHLLQNHLQEEDEAALLELRIEDHRAELTDFAQTAAISSCMDAVVSVDTAVAHLAGALGIPLMLLLSSNSDWRWMRERTETPWYPSARLFRQRKCGEWATVMEDVGREMASRFSARLAVGGW